jgi:hypothetical protein
MASVLGYERITNNTCAVNANHFEGFAYAPDVGNSAECCTRDLRCMLGFYTGDGVDDSHTGDLGCKTCFEM